jgi:hypothetical protein
MRAALVSERGALSAGDGAAQQTSAFVVAAFAYRFLFSRFWLLLRVLLLPILTAGLVLYFCLNAYISGLLLFLAMPGPRVASVALGTLAAGIFVSLFCYSLAVSSVMNILLGKPQRSPWALLKTERQDWRVYAAYLRLLLIMSAGLLGAAVAGVYIAPLLRISQVSAPWLLTLLSAGATYWLIARIGFLIAPVIAGGEGPVLRAGWSRSSRSALRNCLLIALLAAPACLVWFAGEFLFRLDSAIPYAAPGAALADYAKAMAQTLGEFVALASASSFIGIVLLTAGAMRVYGKVRAGIG